MTWLDDARVAIKASSKESTIYIGADSVRYKKGKNKDGSDKWFARYATVVVVHKNSKNGCNVFSNVTVLPDFGQIRTRLMTEVQLSLETFSAIEDILDGRGLEIHLDVNPDPAHASNVVAKEAAGWVIGMGLVHKIKNEAWAASTAADHCARGKLTPSPRV